MADSSTHIVYCQAHYDELLVALVDRQLEADISRTSEELVDKLEAGEMDAALEASTAITSASMALFGPEVILNNDGCPVCTFKNIITHVADHMAVKYRDVN